MVNDDFNKNVGNLIKTIRKAMQISQSTLAEKLNITPQQIHKYETGVNNINAEMIWKISNIFCCDISIFFPKTDIKNKNILKLAEDHNHLAIKKKGKNDDAVFLLKKFFQISKENKEKVLEYIDELATKEKEDNKKTN